MRAFGVAMLALLLGGCGWVQVGEQLPPGGSRPPPAERAAVQPLPASGRIAVRPGDNVHAIARRYGLSMRDIIRLNGLAAPYRLLPGQTLRLPTPRRHVVAAGDSLWSISRQHDVPLSALARVNRIEPPYRILPGDTLQLPGRTEPAATPPAAKAKPVAKAPTKPAARETPQSSAATTSGRAPVPPPPPARASARKQPAKPVAKPAKPVTVAEPPAAPVQTALKAPPARSSGRFLRPLAGPIVAGFGPQPDGLHNDGINIAAPEGSAVHAAEAGSVAYAGNELPGYGNLLLIKHSDGWVSAYAHNEHLLVKRGDTVRRGQRIAMVGSSGRVTTPQLHFELRRQGRAVDPTPHLQGG